MVLTKEHIFLPAVALAALIIYLAGRILIPEPGIDPMKTGIYIGNKSVVVTVKPDASYAGSFIVEPKCEYMGLRLLCGEEGDMREVRHKPYSVSGEGLGIGCPPDPDNEDQSIDWGEEFIDVVRVPQDPVPLYVECDLSDLFDLTPEELGIGESHLAGGKAINCILEGEYNTVEISDPSPVTVPDPDDPYDWCLDDQGRVRLSEVTMPIEPKGVFFLFPGTSQENIARSVPWMFSGHAPQGLGEPDWSHASGQPAPPDGEVIGGADDDGYEDTTEIHGYLFANQLQLTTGTYPGHASTYIGPCGTGTTRTLCVDDNDKELFTIIEPLSSGSDFPDVSSAENVAWFFEKISAASGATGGLNIDVHALSQPALAETPDLFRKVNASDNQTAIRVIESDETLSTGPIFGESKVGVPNSAGVVTIYPIRIRQKICEMCGGTYDDQGGCTDGNFGGPDCNSVTDVTATGESLIKEFVKYVAHHEVGHSLNLVVTVPNDNYHHLTGPNSIFMLKEVPYKKKGTKVTWYLGYEYCAACQQNRDLTWNNPQ